MAKTNCPDFEVIISYLEEQLPPESLREFEQHLSVCPKCTTLLDQAKELLNLLHEDAELVVSEHSHQQAVALFRPWFEAQPKKAQRPPKHLLARLIHSNGLFQDGLALPHAPGLRALSLSGQNLRQLLYEVDVPEGFLELDLQIQRAENGEDFTLLGQVLGLANPIDRVELASLEGSESPTLEAKADETATFQFHSLLKGQYRLLIYCGLEIIEISSFEI